MIGTRFGLISKQVINFGPGPRKIPEKVFRRAKNEILDYNGTGISIMETGPRTATFKRILGKTEQDLRDLINIPNNYKVLFLQGDGVGQFSAIPMNIIRGGSAGYLVTGYWSSKAAKEAEKHGQINQILSTSDVYKHIPPKDTWTTNPKDSYLYYCDDETIQGIEFPMIPQTSDVPLVCDMSSNFLSRPFDVTKFGVVVAGSHKNMGCPGVTVVIVRDDLIGHAAKYCPSVLNYEIQSDENSCYNTPPTYSNQVDKEFRSRMNIPFTIGNLDGVGKMQEKFIKETLELDMLSVKRHRDVCGLRASLYNFVTVEDTQKLADFMRYFQDRHH